MFQLDEHDEKSLKIHIVCFFPAFFEKCSSNDFTTSCSGLQVKHLAQVI